MSRIGYNPVLLPLGVSAEMSAGTLRIKGPRGDVGLCIPSSLQVEIKSGNLVIIPAGGKGVAKDLHGLIRTKIQNTVTGVYQGFQRQLAIYGVGYSARVTETTLTLQLGYSHLIVYKAPAGITFVVEEQPKAAGSDLQCFVFVRGHDRELVGQVAATLRAYRPPEPYKGKGIRYFGEHVRRKAGKAAATAGGGAKA